MSRNTKCLTISRFISIKRKRNASVCSAIKGAFRDGNYQRTRSHSGKLSNIIGLVALLLVAALLFGIAKFYSLL